MTEVPKDVIEAAEQALIRQEQFTALPRSEQVRQMADWLLNGGIGDQPSADASQTAKNPAGQQRLRSAFAMTPEEFSREMAMARRMSAPVPEFAEAVMTPELEAQLRGIDEALRRGEAGRRWIEAIQVDGDILLTTFRDGEFEFRETLAKVVNADIAPSASDYEHDPDFDPRPKAREYIAALRSIAQMVEEKWIVE